MDYVMTFSYMYKVFLSYQPPCLSSPLPLSLLPTFLTTDIFLLSCPFSVMQSFLITLLTAEEVRGYLQEYKQLRNNYTTKETVSVSQQPLSVNKSPLLFCEGVLWATIEEGSGGMPGPAWMAVFPRTPLPFLLSRAFCPSFKMVAEPWKVIQIFRSPKRRQPKRRVPELSPVRINAYRKTGEPHGGLCGYIAQVH